MEPTAFNAGATQQQQQKLNYEQLGQVSLPHMIPLPAATPWNLDSMPWTVATKNVDYPGAVMQFRAQNELLHDTAQKRALLHQKRKSNLSAPHPPKQFISEEKITAHFNGLHISSDYIQQTDDGLKASIAGLGGNRCNEEPARFGKDFANLTYEDYQLYSKELEEKLKKAQRITICDEIKKFHEEQKRTTFLPHALLNRIEKPCTALVLWQKPPLLDILEATNPTKSRKSQNNANGTDQDGFLEADAVIDFDIGDNNNSCNMDLNSSKYDGMDTDL